MIRSLTPPSAGQPIRASSVAELLREIRANRLVNGSGYRTKRTPNGTSLVIPVAKPSASSPKLPGCFEIRRPSGEEGEEGYDNGGFDNPYYNASGKTFYCADAEDIGFNYVDCIIALSMSTMSSTPAAEIVEYESMSELQQAQRDMSKNVVPLYKIGEKGDVECDFRTIPSAAMGEFPS